MEQKTTTVFSISKPTPMWATWIFRTEFVLNKAVLFILGSTHYVTADQVKESLVWIAGLDMVVWGIGRFLGVKRTDIEAEFDK